MSGFIPPVATDSTRTLPTIGPVHENDTIDKWAFHKAICQTTFSSSIRNISNY